MADKTLNPSSPTAGNQPVPSDYLQSTGGPTALEKRKREGEGEAAPPSLHPLHKTSLCSYFRRDSASCSHGATCRYAHGEVELHPRPDNSWDPTSDRAKKALRSSPDGGEDGEGGEMEASGEVMMTEFVAGEGGCLDAELSKCLVHLPRNWGPDQLRSFLDEHLQGISYGSAKKKKGMTVGFVSFASAEQLKVAVEELEGKSVGNKTIKVADVLPRSYDDKIKSDNVDNGTNGISAEDSKSIDGAADGNGTGHDDGSVLKGRSACSAVTTLAHMPYIEQLEQKKSTNVQMLKKLTRNARKACLNGVSSRMDC